MPGIQFYFGNTDYWNLFHNVSFDGDNKIIQISDGVTEISVETDIYSSWKEWSILRDNTKFLAAFDESIGGNEIGFQRALGSTYFLTNGWKIRTWEGDHRLIVNGNIFASDGSSPFTSTRGNHTILINLRTSNLTDKIGDATLTLNNLTDAVWNQVVTNHTTQGSFGEKVRKNLPR